ncbi:MAG: helix-turn-helix domain-containing protein [Solirubrobacteraceae bacterium]
MTAQSNRTAALFVRIPQAQARALDRLAFESGRPKQAVVSELIARYVEGDPPPQRPPSIELPRSGDPVLGWHSFRAQPEPDVLTLEGVAELLAVEPDRVAELARGGELPGREIGGEWRFARAAVLAWLAGASARDG